MYARAATDELEWLVKRIGCALTPWARGVAAVDGTGRIRGMLAFDVWTGNGVQVHAAVETPIAWRALGPAFFAYPFLETGKGVVMAAVRGDNRASLGVCKHLGMVECGRVEDGIEVGVDMVLLALQKKDWERDTRRSVRARTATKEAA